MNADAQATTFSGCRHTCRFHSMVELFDSGRYPVDEVTSGLCKPDTACLALEQTDAKVLLQSLHSCADAGLRYPERVGRVAKVQILRNGERLDERGHGNVITKRGAPPGRR